MGRLHTNCAESELIWINGVFAKRLTREQMCTYLSLSLCLFAKRVAAKYYIPVECKHKSARSFACYANESDLRCTHMWFQITGRIQLASIQFLLLLKRAVCPNPAARNLKPVALVPLQTPGLHSLWPSVAIGHSSGADRFLTRRDPKICALPPPAGHFVCTELLFIVHPFKSLFLYFNALAEKLSRCTYIFTNALLYFLRLILFRAGYSRNYISMHADRWPAEKKCMGRRVLAHRSVLFGTTCYIWPLCGEKSWRRTCFRVWSPWDIRHKGLRAILAHFGFRSLNAWKIGAMTAAKIHIHIMFCCKTLSVHYSEYFL